ncbi:protein kinase domain-containing protein [Nocardia tengchongensis]
MRSGDVFAGYVIERELGRGGMGSVYLAKHPRLPRMTALKLLNQEMFSDDEIRARFIREADLVARLDHPNIVTVYDRGDEGEQLWISMQFIDGVNASSISPGTLPPVRAIQIITETAKALDYAHGLNVLHRDVKPANILLARSSSKTGSSERVYLTDFGIARLRDDTGHLTQTGTVTATLAYASPEQLTGASLDGRSDQYSLACTLFQLLTGAVPFEGTSPAAVIRGHLQQPPPPASPLRQALPRAIDAVLAKALAKRPADRYRSCVEFATAAERALSAPATPAPPRPPTPAHPQPVVAPRPPTPAHPQPVIQRPPTPTPSTPRPLVGPGPAYTNQNPAYPAPPTSGPSYPNQQVSGPSYPNQQVSSPGYPNQQASSPGYPNQPAPQHFTNQSTPPQSFYAPSQPYQPRPTPPPTYAPPQRNSNTTAWLIAAIVTVLVIVIIVIAIIVKAA